MIATFTSKEPFDREENYPSIPSPRGVNWKNYLKHGLTILKVGLAAYTQRRYARLSFNNYIKSEGEKVWLVKSITKNEQSIGNIGAVEMAANLPFGIKDGKRYPGTRHIECGIKTLDH